MGLSKEDVREIIQLLDDLKATELHLRTRHYTLTVRRDGDGWVDSVDAAEAPAEAAVEPATDGSPAADAETFAVRAPLAGTFYRAPKPGDAPYVEVGSQVDEETVVGIVETMKLMNSIHAGVTGRVAEICVNNAELAEQGAVLMRIAPGE
jgi:acetyl-CoA carboxylase biotin carboxyl carrier protein